MKKIVVIVLMSTPRTRITGKEVFLRQQLRFAGFPVNTAYLDSFNRIYFHETEMTVPFAIF